MKTSAIFALILAALVNPKPAAALASAGPTEVVIHPSDYGMLYLCNGCGEEVIHFAEALNVTGYIQGIARYPTAQITGPVTHAVITVTPYSLPMSGKSIDIYGIASGTGTATFGDASSGIPLGTFAIPDGLVFYQEISFDVTNFVSTSHVPYIGFNFRAGEGGSFTEPQLRVTFVPEPCTTVLLLSVAILVVARRRRSLPRIRA